MTGASWKQALRCSRSDPKYTLSRQSAQRWKLGRPLGRVDGVPVGGKGEIDVAPNATTGGAVPRVQKCATPFGAIPQVEKRCRTAHWQYQHAGLGILPDGAECSSRRRNPSEASRKAGKDRRPRFQPACARRQLEPMPVIQSAFRILVLCGRAEAHVSDELAKSERNRWHGVSRILVRLRKQRIGRCRLYLPVLSGLDPRDPNTRARAPAGVREFDGSLRGLWIALYRPWFKDAAVEIR